MKLNYKRTLCVGFAFFLICAFWQAYDNTVPLILINKFGMNQTVSGMIMALDNIMALFMLPLFGSISDRSHHRMGRRTPFILIGTTVAAIAFTLLAVTDAAQLKQLEAYAAVDDPAVLRNIYAEQKDSELMTPAGERFVLGEMFTEDAFAAIRTSVEEDGTGETNPDYTDYVMPARRACAAKAVHENPGTLVRFVVLLFVALVAMAVFRSPAVALMPDVTVKPLRSKANAVINLMGAAGGILVLGLGIVFAVSAVKNAMMSYVPYFAVISGLMLVSLTVFMLTVREPRFVREMHEESRRYGIEADEQEAAATGRKLGAGERRSLLFILLSIMLWFFGYNAVTSKYSVYAGSILQKDYNLTLIIAQAAAIVSYLPVGIIASKIGRKKTILGGIVMLTAAFTIAGFLRAGSPAMLMNAMFALAGIGWATINVNSFPMVVEMCSGGDVGKYTGFYYTASMAAQVATPIVSGYLMDRAGMTVLFPYAAVFVGCAFVTMLFVRHGDSRPEAKRGLEALEDMDS